MTTAGIGQSASKVQGVFGPPITVQNTGTVPIYLGSDSSVNTLNGWAVAPSAYVVWAGGTQLWAVTDAGKTSTLQVSDQALSTFIPAPTSVSIDGGTVELSGTADVTLVGTPEVSIPGGVTINNAALPITGDVTATIESGTIDVTGNVIVGNSTLNVGGTVGSAAVPVLLATYTAIKGTLIDSGTTWGGGFYDVSKYSSILVRLTGVPRLANPSPQILNNWTSVTVTQGNSVDDPAFSQGYDQGVFTFSQTVQQTFLVPTHAAFVSVNVSTVIQTLASQGMTMTAQVYGIASAGVVTRQYVNDFFGGGQLNGNGIGSFVGTTPASSSTMLYIPISSRNLKFSVASLQNNNASTGLNIGLSHNVLGAQVPVYRKVVNNDNNNYFGYGEARFACYPAFVFGFTPTGAASGTTFQIVLTSEN